MKMTEQRKLYERMKDGDQSAVDELYDGFHPMILSIAGDLCFDQQDFDDLVQEGSLGFLECLKRWDIKRGSLSTYSYLYIFGYMMNYLKRRKRIFKRETDMEVYYEEGSDFVEYEYAVTYDDEEQFEFEEIKEKIYKHLSETEKEIFDLTYFEGLTAKEIGKKINKNVSTITSHIYNAKLKIRKIFAHTDLGFD